MDVNSPSLIACITSSTPGEMRKLWSIPFRARESRLCAALSKSNRRPILGHSTMHDPKLLLANRAFTDALKLPRFACVFVLVFRTVCAWNRVGVGFRRVSNNIFGWLVAQFLLYPLSESIHLRLCFLSIFSRSLGTRLQSTERRVLSFLTAFSLSVRLRYAQLTRTRAKRLSNLVITLRDLMPNCK